MSGDKIKIALVSSGLGHVKRGIETWTEDLGIALHERGVDVTVYKGGGRPNAAFERVIPCAQRDSSFVRWLIKVRPGFLWRVGLGDGYSFEQLTFSLNILPELILRQFDVIHTQDPHLADNCRKFARCGLIKSRVILAHGTEESFAYLTRFDYLQHLAPFHQQEMEKAGFRVKKSFAIGNFVDTEVFQPRPATNLRRELNIPENAFVIASVAAIKRQHKRIDYLIEEVSRLNDRSVYLVVAGAVEAQTEEVKKLGITRLGDRVRFLENFPRARIGEVHAAADVFALCSLKEMMPIALLESIASGLPAVIHRYPVEEWMIGEGGEAIDMTAAGELAKTISKYRDTSCRKQGSLKAREHAVRYFSKPVIVEQILKMYDEVIQTV